MKTVHITLTVPEDLKELLFTTIGKGSVSKFVSDTLRKALQKKKRDLATDYIAASQDQDNLQVMNDWAAIEGEDFFGFEGDE